MKRLTDNKIKCMADFCEAQNCVNYESDGCCSYERYQRLAEYEDAEEQGLLAWLPCKVGEPIYHIIDDCELSGDCGTKRMCKGCEYRNLFVEEDVFHLCLLTDKGDLRSGYYANREAAEKALEDA